ncbi:MAG: hypothetical protein P1V20_19045 [Verrucomicrobiales bacterium]|nr:hypothetical protein [Verrucomicrobiales bacterium]
MAENLLPIIRDQPLVALIVLAVLAVHLRMQYQFWFRPEPNIFQKYGNRFTNPVEVAKRAYYAKAVWLITFIFGVALNIEFSTVLISTFFLYALITVCLFGWKGYPLIQMIFAAVAAIVAVVGGGLF